MAIRDTRPNDSPQTLSKNRWRLYCAASEPCFALINHLSFSPSSAHRKGDWRGVGVLHRRLDRLLLPEDAPRHARPPHPQRHRPDRQQHVRVDARQVPGQFT